jgi:hypothetical protein
VSAQDLYDQAGRQDTEVRRGRHRLGDGRQALCPEKKIYTAVIDRVFVKPICQLTAEDLHGENPDLTNVDDLVVFLQSIYDKPLTPNDIVTVVYFSEIIE